MPNHKPRNQTIKHELRRQGISQLQAAYDLGMDRVKFNLCCNGWELPTPEKRAAIAEYLGMPEAELFTI